jgi:hypothetical protein
MKDNSRQELLILLDQFNKLDEKKQGAIRIEDALLLLQ